MAHNEKRWNITLSQATLYAKSCMTAHKRPDLYYLKLYKAHKFEVTVQEIMICYCWHGFHLKYTE